MVSQRRQQSQRRAGGGGRLRGRMTVLPLEAPDAPVLHDMKFLVGLSLQVFQKDDGARAQAQNSRRLKVCGKFRNPKPQSPKAPSGSPPQAAVNGLHSPQGLERGGLLPVGPREADATRGASSVAIPSSAAAPADARPRLKRLSIFRRRALSVRQYDLRRCRYQGRRRQHPLWRGHSVQRASDRISTVVQSGNNQAQGGRSFPPGRQVSAVWFHPLKWTHHLRLACSLPHEANW